MKRNSWLYRLIEGLIVLLSPLLILAFLTFIMVAYSYKANADDSIWITSGLWSRHPNEGYYKYNQHNVGIGIAYQTGAYTYTFGEYNNSLFKHSDYAGIITYPYSIGPVQIGYFAGAVSGYASSPKFYPAAAPMVSYEYHSFGINLIVIPSVVTALQLKIKVW